MKSLSQFPGWEGVEKGSKSENLPQNSDFATCGKQGAHHSSTSATPGAVCCKIKQFIQY